MKLSKELSENARYPQLVRDDDFSDSPSLRFPEGMSRIGRWAPVNQENGTREKHPAEIALERVQRRLDNLRSALGPDFCRSSDEGPWAA